MQNIIIKILNYIYYWNTIEFINGCGHMQVYQFPGYFLWHEWKRADDNLSFLPHGMFIISAD